MTGNSAATMGLQRAERKVILACAGWALLSGVLFVVAAIMGDRTGQFAVAVSLLKVGSFLMATVLCWRNAMTPEILSGRSVWQAIAVGMAFYALGDITVILWRSLWDITTTVSLSSVFYAASYLFLAIGLLLAVVPRQITLNWIQTLSIAVAGVLGIVLASWIAFQVPAVEPTTDDEIVGSEDAGVAAVILQSGSDERGTVEDLGTIASLPDEKIATESRKAPAIIQTIEQRLNPITRHFGLLYVAGDCVLVVLAVALLVAFWGGTYSEAWKLVALAGLCLYVADMFWIYEVGRGIYRQGAFWEIFWILSALFFGLSAGVEYGISLQMRSRTASRNWL
ncbi:MAG: hypothetical protein AAFY72_04305 [Cyanobacteria bacterium J06649_4]